MSATCQPARQQASVLRNVCVMYTNIAGRLVSGRIHLFSGYQILLSSVKERVSGETSSHEAITSPPEALHSFYQIPTCRPLTLLFPFDATLVPALALSSLSSLLRRAAVSLSFAQTGLPLPPYVAIQLIYTLLRAVFYYTTILPHYLDIDQIWPPRKQVVEHPEPAVEALPALSPRRSNPVSYTHLTLPTKA